MTLDSCSISDFYGAKSVFITGATGFVGKVLLEKLLRSCPGIQKIFILIRELQGKDPVERLKELMSCEVFDLVREQQPQVLKKVVGITGDLCRPQLGVSLKDLKTLSKTVFVVFHLAAKVNFDQPLKQAVNLNVTATRHMLEICHKLPKLVALVHVSTAYAHCNLPEIDEIIYPPPVPIKQIIDVTAWMEEALLDFIKPQLIGSHPNTYTFTKSLSENLLLDECSFLPIAIVRPSIVAGVWKKPCPGWFENLNGPAGIIVPFGKGILRTMVIHGEDTADIIPVDVVVNLMIAVAWYTALRSPKNNLVYNCTSGSLNKLSWNNLQTFTFTPLLKYPSVELFRYPSLKYQYNPFLNSLCEILQHYLPALFTDLTAYLFFRKPEFRLLRLYQKVNKVTRSLRFFTTREWKFHCNNVIKLRNSLSPQDQEIFNVDVRKINWPLFWENYVYACRRLIFKEDPSTILASRKSLRRKYCWSKVTHLLGALGVLTVLFSQIVSVSKVWSTVMATAIKIQTFPREEREIHAI